MTPKLRTLIDETPLPTSDDVVDPFARLSLSATLIGDALYPLRCAMPRNLRLRYPIAPGDPRFVDHLGRYGGEVRVFVRFDGVAMRTLAIRSDLHTNAGRKRAVRGINRRELAEIEPAFAQLCGADIRDPINYSGFDPRRGPKDYALALSAAKPNADDRLSSLGRTVFERRALWGVLPDDVPFCEDPQTQGVTNLREAHPCNWPRAVTEEHQHFQLNAMCDWLIERLPSLLVSYYQRVSDFVATTEAHRADL